MLKVRVTMLNGEEFLIEKEINEKEFDDLVRFSAPTDFLITTGGVRLQLNKVLCHQPIGETDV